MNSRLRILSYNIHKGFDWSNREYILQQLRDAVRTTQSQFVFLQEVSGDSTLHEDVQFEYLADTIWSHYAYGKNALTSRGHHGNATLSMFPLVQWSNHDISTNPFEHRGILHGVAQTEIQRVHLLNTHLGLFEGERQKQALWIQNYIQQHIPAGEPVILAGDFNDWRERLTRVFEPQGLFEAHLQIQGRVAASYPAAQPFLRLDRVYVRGLEIAEVQTLRSEPWTRLSDHLPLCIDLKT